MDIQFRQANPDDVDSAVPLIHSSGPAAFNYIFSVDHQDQALDFLRYAFVRSQGQFSFVEHTLITDDNKVTGCGSLMKSGNTVANLFINLKQIVSFYGIAKSVGVIYRGLKVERIIPPPKSYAAYIGNLGVMPQGKGYGSRLIDQLITMGKENNLSIAALDVAETNGNARRLYERMGFIEQRHNPANKKSKWGSLVGHSYMEKSI
jgi:ribosomal protein S18 acetylase RimI-like enzyme